MCRSAATGSPANLSIFQPGSPLLARASRVSQLLSPVKRLLVERARQIKATTHRLVARMDLHDEWPFAFEFGMCRVPTQRLFNRRRTAVVAGGEPHQYVFRPAFVAGAVGMDQSLLERLVTGPQMTPGLFDVADCVPGEHESGIVAGFLKD